MIYGLPDVGNTEASPEKRGSALLKSKPSSSETLNQNTDFLYRLLGLLVSLSHTHFILPFSQVNVTGSNEMIEFVAESRKSYYISVLQHQDCGPARLRIAVAALTMKGERYLCVLGNLEMGIIC